MKRVKEGGKSEKVRIAPTTMTIDKKEASWTNESVKMIDKISCFVSDEIKKVMRGINKKFHSDEFSIFCKSNYNSHTKVLEIEPVYYIPEQEVSGSAVEYKEDAPEGFDVVIHKHPSGVKSFSGTDENYINGNFDVSLLWLESDEFIKGQVRIQTTYGYMKVPVEFVDSPRDYAVIPDEQLEKIKERKYEYNYCKDRWGNMGGWYNDRYGNHGNLHKEGNDTLAGLYDDYWFGNSESPEKVDTKETDKSKDGAVPKNHSWPFGL